mmetsp:Transcript_822/g.2061  ORF Transcript_822/g.2061 Transcript_822/m.2061 type:complete len:209 (+) Transcript_822:1286-1912(+)
MHQLLSVLLLLLLLRAVLLLLPVSICLLRTGFLHRDTGAAARLPFAAGHATLLGLLRLPIHAARRSRRIRSAHVSRPLVLCLLREPAPARLAGRRLLRARVRSHLPPLSLRHDPRRRRFLHSLRLARPRFAGLLGAAHGEGVVGAEKTAVGRLPAAVSAAEQPAEQGRHLPGVESRSTAALQHRRSSLSPLSLSVCVLLRHRSGGSRR